MIIGKLIKPCKICIYEVESDGGEVESFSLLKLKLNEFIEIIREALNQNKSIEHRFRWVCCYQLFWRRYYSSALEKARGGAPSITPGKLCRC